MEIRTAQKRRRSACFGERFASVSQIQLIDESSKAVPKDSERLASLFAPPEGSEHTIMYDLQGDYIRSQHIRLLECTSFAGTLL